MRRVLSYLLVIVCMTFTAEAGKERLQIMFDAQEYYSFDKAAKAVILFSASEISGSAPIVTIGGKTYTPKKMYEIRKSFAQYKVEVPSNVDPGTYTVRVQLKNKKDSIEDATRLTIFPTDLAKRTNEDGEERDSYTSLIQKLVSLHQGDLLELSIIPSSGATIPQNQFRIFTYGIEGDKEEKIYLGLQIAEPYSPRISSDAKECGIKVVWTNPHDVSETVTIFPKDKEFHVFQPKSIKK